MKIENLSSPKGNVVPNQFEITIKDTVFFKSYSSIIAKIKSGRVFLDEHYWNYSRTTSKYRSIFLGESTIETQRKINSGEYILMDLQNDFKTIDRAASNFKFLNQN
jgi:hypothetical protein